MSFVPAVPPPNPARSRLIFHLIKSKICRCTAAVLLRLAWWCLVLAANSKNLNIMVVVTVVAAMVMVERYR